MDAELKELLTLAAKACSIDLVEDICSDLMWIREKPGDNSGLIWAPHLDDGDGARMEANRGLRVSWGSAAVYVDHYSIGEVNELYADHNGDRQAARRWASFRAAAQIGKGMT